MFAIVLAAAAMVSCAGNANKSKAPEAGCCTEQCEEGKCTKPVEEQCEKCKAATEAAACEKACEKACEGKEACAEKKECKGEHKACGEKKECGGCKAE